MKSTFNDLDSIPLLRFLLQRNILFSSPYSSFLHFPPPFFLQCFSNVCSHLSVYYSSTFSNFFLTSSNIYPQIFCHPTHIATLPCTSPVTPFSYILLFPFSFLSSLIVLLLLLPPFQTP